MVSRRALLGAGALLLVGCGPPDEPEIDASEVWNDSLKAAQVAALAYERPDKGAEDRVARLEAAVKRAGGTPAIRPGSSPKGKAVAIAAEQRALRAHVASVGLLFDAPSRELLSQLIVETAAAEARLSAEAESFPGQPLNPKK